MRCTRVRSLTGLGLVVWTAAGCGRHVSGAAPDGRPPMTCGGALPAFAERTPAGLRARCGDIEVAVEPLAGGAVHLRYAAAGEPALPSGAIVDGPATVTVPLRTPALPTYARAGAILPAAGDGGALVVDVYPGAAPSSFTLYEDDGGSLAGASARVQIDLAPRADGADVSLVRSGALAVPARDVTVRVHRVDGAVSGVTANGAAVPFAYDPDDRSLAATVPDAASLALAFSYDPAIADPRPPVAVTFEVHVPASTPAGAPICVASSANGWAQVPLAWTAPGVARGQLTVPRGDWVDYKFTRGSWDTVEKAADCSERSNRTRIGAAGTRVDTVAAWRDQCGT